MNDPAPRTRNQTGPGCLMLIAVLVGTVIGLRNHQSSAGIVIGMAVAVVIATAVWAWDRFR